LDYGEFEEINEVDESGHQSQVDPNETIEQRNQRIVVIYSFNNVNIEKLVVEEISRRG